MNKPLLYADLILPLPLGAVYTYEIPEEFISDVAVGIRVVVQFGRKKIYTALVVALHHNRPEAYETKPIMMVLDQHPIVFEKQLAFWKWMSDYYMCTTGEVYKAAVPSGFRLESESRIFVNPVFDSFEILSEREQAVHKLFDSNKFLTLQDITKSLDIKNAMPLLKSLLEKQVVFAEEEMVERYKPKLKDYIEITPEFKANHKLQLLFDALTNAPKQLKLLMHYVQESGVLTGEPVLQQGKKELMTGCGATSPVLNGLIEKGVFRIIQKEIGYLDNTELGEEAPKLLTDFQMKGLEDIQNQFKSKNVVLLHGITSSGKTELYIQLIKEYLDQGKQVLYMLPEIAITTQIINRLRSVFGNRVGVYHSKFNDNERVDIWNSVLRNDESSYSLILGVRSSVFLPFNNLGLVIVDEEHENTYKQYDPAPRYQARDAAVVLSRIHEAKTLLGTATPSFESYYNARNGKYGLVEINRRFLDIKLPEIVLANVREARKKKQMKSHFTPLLLEKIGNALENQEQVILFQNRRGFSPYLECETCGWIPECEHCDVKLTYHKNFNSVKCHYCGYSISVPHKCAACGSTDMQTRGFGTEKIEDEIQIFFPEARVKRMDLDTTRSRKAYEQIIYDFEEKKIDILVGTQMVTKGLDFDNVSLVGIMNADNMLNFQDFRAFERSFQLMAQVSGRAGRKGKQGEVVIQTSDPAHPVIKDVVSNDFSGFYLSQIGERDIFHYPPFYRLIEITVRHKNKDILNKAAREMAALLREYFGDRVLGPEYPEIGRISTYYLKKIMIKIEREKAVQAVKTRISEIIENVTLSQDDKQLRTAIDVDPQ